MNNYLKLLLLVILLFTLFSCGQDKVVKKYYIFDYSAKEISADSGAVKTLPYSVRIDPFITAGPISGNKIALRNKSNEIQYYFYHFWAENPASAIRYFLFKQLKQARLFRRCNLRAGILPADYLINGRIDHLERFASQEKYVAHLAMSLELQETKSGRIIVQYSFDRANPIGEDSPMNVFAKEISAILNEEIQHFINNIRLKLK